MVHLYALFPALIFLSAITFWLSRKNPKEPLYSSFRNFFLIWSACTVFIGSAETFFHETKVVFTALAFGLPFLYVAAAYLITLPFVISKNLGRTPTILSLLAITLGAFYGLSVFIMANNLESQTGFLRPLFTHLTQYVLYYHIASMLAIFLPIGVFFLTRNFFIGAGLIIAGLGEWYHVVGLHAAQRDVVIVVGFVLIVLGLLVTIRKRA